MRWPGVATGVRRSLLLCALAVLATGALAVAEAAVLGAGAGMLAAATDDTPVVGSTISAGYAHTCGVQTDGTLACWGDNGFGQATPPAGTFTQISAGYDHTCGVRTDGTLACWGNNGFGRATPPGGTFTQISAGTFHTCGVRTDGTLTCWGLNGVGAATPPAGTFTQISAGSFHSCGVQTDGTLACWGYNASGQATPPAGSFTLVSAGGNEPNPVESENHTCGVRTDGTVACWGHNNNGQATPPAGNFTQVSAGSFHTCGVQTDGTLACWGYNNEGQATPPAATFSSPQVSAGWAHTCGVQMDGTLACWGLNNVGQVTPPGGTFTQVSAGYFHSCGVQTDDTLACWGEDSSGQSTPPAGTFTQVSAGASHTCGVQTAGTLACWGDNSDGQATPPLSTFTQVSAGVLHTCGVETAGTAACWGDNSEGQATPAAGTFTQISAGDFHACGVQTDGTLACWGYNFSGQATPPAGTFTQVSGGGDHTCGVQTDGTLACWGFNGWGQTTPPLGTFTQVSAGKAHTCGLQTDGILVCWGRNTDGQATPPGTMSSQTITVTTPAPPSAVVNQSFGVAATASSGLAVAITTRGGCSGSGIGSATITMLSGTTACVVHYNQSGDGNYSAAPEVTSATEAGPPADLVVSALSAPGTGGAGSAITVTDTTKNQRIGTSVPSTTQLYLSSNNTLSEDDVALGSRAVAALAQNATSAGPTLVTIPADTAPGAYFLIAKADAGTVNPEVSETNNTRSRSIKIGPDLTVPTLTVPSVAAAGASIDVTDTTRNAAGASPADPSTTRFFLSVNSTVGGGDIELGARGIGTLAPGTTSSGPTSLPIPADTAPGTYFIVAKADADEALFEWNDNNNTRAKAIKIGPDLIVSSLSPPGSVAAGASFTLKETTKNKGGASTVVTTTTRYYLSLDTVVDDSDPDLGERTVGVLAVGGSSATILPITIPQGTAPGSYFILAVADDDTAVLEILEANNKKSRPITVTP